MMDETGQAVRDFMADYELLVNRCLAGNPEIEAVCSAFAPEFLGASPNGVAAGRNDGSLREAVARQFEHYRDTGAVSMHVNELRFSPIDKQHCLASAGWTAVYRRPDGTETLVSFDVHYLIQVLDGGPQIFGWIAGDEEATLRSLGIT